MKEARVPTNLVCGLVLAAAAVMVAAPISPIPCATEHMIGDAPAGSGREAPSVSTGRSPMRSGE